MKAMEDGNTNSLVKMCNEDIALCESIVRAEEWLRINDRIEEERVLKKLQIAMIQRIFYPGRFRLSTLLTVLTNDLPLPYRSHKSAVAMSEQLEDSDALASTVSEVLESCLKWTADMVLESRLSGASLSPHTLQMQSEGRVFLLFLELCQRRAEVCEGFMVTTAQTKSVHPSDKLVNLTTEKFIGQRALQMVTSALEATEHLYADIDLCLQQNFHNNSTINDANISWLSHRITELASSIQSITPAIGDFMQSSMLSFDNNDDMNSGRSGECARVWLTACFGDTRGSGSVGLCGIWPNKPSTTSLTPFQATGHNTFSPQGLQALSHMARSEILRLYTEARSTAVLFSLLTSTGGSLHPSLMNLITAELLPQALFSLVYCGLLLWMDSVRLLDNTLTLDSIDLFDLFLTSAKGKTESQLSNSSSTNVHEHRFISLWESYIRYSVTSGGLSIPQTSSTLSETLKVATIQVLEKSQPSTISFLSHYLSSVGQYSVVSRMASVLVWGKEFIERGTKSNEVVETTYQRKQYMKKVVDILADIIDQHQLKSSVALGEFLECVRQLLTGPMKNQKDDERNSRSGDRNSERYIILSNELHCRLEDLIASVDVPVPLSSSNTLTNYGDIDCPDTPISFGEIQSLQNAGFGTDRNTVCLLERLAVVLKISDAFQALTEISSTDNAIDQETASLLTCCKYPSLFLHFHKIAHLADIVEITKRIRAITLNPWNCKAGGNGANADLAIRANYALGDAVDDAIRTIDTFGSENNTSILLRMDPEVQGMVKVILSALQVVCWSRVFVHAIEQHSYDEALGAIVRLVELSHISDNSIAPRVKERLDSFGVSDWRASLCSLVMHACTTGKLGWLCSLDDIWVRDMHITGGISDELERLASSECSVDETSTSYYECSCVFALSRQNLQEAARQSVMHVQSLDNKLSQGDNKGLIHSSAQIRALSLAVVALSAVRPEDAAFVLTRIQTPSSSNKRPHSVIVDEEKRVGGTGPSEVESSDILVMRSVQQLSTSLQLRLMSSSNEKIAREGKETSRLSSALHLAVSLEECGHGPEEKAVIELAGEAIAECIGRIPIGISSSSGAVAPVVFSMAAAISRRCQHSHDSSSSNHDERLRLEYSPQGGQGLKCQTSSLNIWTPLLDYLAFLDTPSQNWALHRAAFEGALHDNILPSMPIALISSFSNAGGDMAVLIRILMSHGLLSQACHTASSLISSAIENSSNGTEQKKKIIPYNVIDEVIIACKKYFVLIADSESPLEDRSNVNRTSKSLRFELSQLESILKTHFMMILSEEMN